MSKSSNVKFVFHDLSGNRERRSAINKDNTSQNVDAVDGVPVKCFIAGRRGEVTIYKRFPIKILRTQGDNLSKCVCEAGLIPIYCSQ